MTSTDKQKVICLGLGRTGTTSLKMALEILGFGPCYHFSVIREKGGEDFETWNNIGDGNGTIDDIKSVLDNYGSALDYPVAMYSDMLLAAYPDAKYILTTRDPAKWEKSMHSTILLAPQLLRQVPTRSLLEDRILHWNEYYLQQKYHQGRLHTHTQQELLDHNERIKRLIPPEKLIIYEVGEGWDRLVEFLGVPKPTKPFPHVNDTAQFQERYKNDLSGRIIDLPSDKVNGRSAHGSNIVE